MKKFISIFLVVLVIGYVGFMWFHSKTSTTEAVSQVRTATVQKGSLEVKVSGSGTVEPVTSEDIKSTINHNEIDEVLVEVGDKVSEGDELITFTDDNDPITAPADGVITTLSVNAGERVANGQVVAHLTNYQDFQTVVQIDELDISKIKLNQEVSITVNAFPSQTFPGRVTAIANEGASSGGVATFDVTIHIGKPKDLKVGMSTEASILTASKKNALYVPVDGVYTNNGQKYVIIPSTGSDNQNSTNEQKTVQTGLANEDYVEITSGVTEGEIIQLPQLATDTSSNNFGQMRQGGFGMGRMGEMGGMNRNGGGSRQSYGRNGN